MNFDPTTSDLLKNMKLRGVCADDVKEVREILQHLSTSIVKPACSKRDPIMGLTLHRDIRALALAIALDVTFSPPRRRSSTCPSALTYHKWTSTQTPKHVTGVRAPVGLYSCVDQLSSLATAPTSFYLHWAGYAVPLLST